MERGEHTAVFLFIGAAALAAAGASLLSLALFGAAFAGGVLWGWLLTLVHGGAAFWIDRQAIGLDTKQFLLRGVGLHLLRLALLVGVLFAAHRCGLASFGPFMTSVLWGYVVFMAAEVWNLHVHTARGVAVTGE